MDSLSVSVDENTVLPSDANQSPPALQSPQLYRYIFVCIFIFIFIYNLTYIPGTLPHFFHTFPGLPFPSKQGGSDELHLTAELQQLEVSM